MKRAMVLLTVFMCLATMNVHAASLELQNAKTFAEIGDWENGIRYLEAYILEHPRDAEARLLLAECYFNWPDRQSVGDSAVDKNQRRARAQMNVLGNLGDEGFNMLIKGLRSDTYNVFYECREVLGKKQNGRAISELIGIAEEELQGEYWETTFHWRRRGRSGYGATYIRLATRERSRAESIISTLIDIERNRDKVDTRVVAFLKSLLENPDTQEYFAHLAAEGLATLDVREARSSVKQALERTISTLPLQSSDNKNYAFEETVYLLDVVVRLSPEDGEQQVRNVLTDMDYQTAAEVLKQTGNAGPDMSTLSHLVTIAFELYEEYPGFWEMKNPDFYMANFLQTISNRAPQLLHDPDIKSRIHSLCDAPQPNVREQVVRLIGDIGDEDAIPILLPKLRATWMKDGYPIPDGTRTGVRHRTVKEADGRTIVETVSGFMWVNEEARSTWRRGVMQIGSPRTAEFLLEKLESDDMAWVFTAARLLEEMREGRALDVLKKRHTELSEKSDEQSRQVVGAIAEAYKRLSGQPIAEGAETVVERRPTTVPQQVKRATPRRTP